MFALIGPVPPFKGGISDTNHSFVKTLINNKQSVTVFSFKVLYPKLLFPGKNQKIKEKKILDYKCNYTINTLNPISWIKTANMANQVSPKYVIFRYWTPWLSICYIIISLFIKKNKIFWIDNDKPHEGFFFNDFFLKILISRMDIIICMSKNVKNNLEKITNKNIYDFFHPINSPTEKLYSKKIARKLLNLDQTKIYFLLFGVIRKYKGIELLIKSLPKVKSKYPESKFLIVGEPYISTKKYKLLAKKLQVDDMLIFEEKFIKTDSIPKWFSACDYLIQPYLKSTQSGVTSMAINFTKPIVSTDVGGLKEVVSDKIGYISKRNHKDLSNKIMDAIENINSNKFEINLKYLKEKNSWENFYKMFVESIKNI